MNPYQQFKNIQSCLICDSLVFQSLQFCRSCCREIYERLHWKKNYESGIAFWYLFDWKEDDRICSKLLKKLKLKKINQETVFFLLRGLAFTANELENFHLQASPAKNPLERDHASIIADAISVKYGLKEYFYLERVPDEYEQKHKNRRQRRGKRFLSKFDPPSGKAIFFVDDVVTTGATLLAANRALAEPEEFIALSLFYRNKREISFKPSKSFAKKRTGLASFFEN